MRQQRDNNNDVRDAVGGAGLSRKNRDMNGTYPSPSLQSNELLALYGPEPDPYGERHRRPCHEDEEFDNADSGDGKDNMQLSLEEGYGMEREQRGVYFSNQEYYQRLEDLKRAHLRNMAELEKMYIRQSVTSKSSGPLPGRRLQRILSDEELIFHDETSSGMSDQSESGVSQEEDDNHYELVLDHSEDRPTPGSCNRKEKPLRNNLREDTPPCCLEATPSSTTTAAHKQPSATPSSRSQVHIELQMRSCCPERGSLGGSVGKTGCRIRDKNCGVRGRNCSRGTATVPQPFKMTVREEEKKKRKVRTRSDIELENSLLRRELDELRECAVKFRASPAPAHTRLPLCDVIGRRSGQPLGNHGDNHVGNRCSYMHVRQASSRSPPMPFSFLERERRRRERRIEAELGNQAPREKRAFKARPVPRSVYCNNSATRRPQKTMRKITEAMWSRHLSTGYPPGSRAEGPGDGRGDREGGEDHSRPRLEAEELGGVSTKQVPNHRNSCWRPEVKGRRRPLIKMGTVGPRKQLELQIEMESETRRGREWSYIDPLLTRTNPRSFCTSLLRTEGLPPPASKSDYISVCKSCDRTVESVL